ncbi:MAG: TolC family protein [Chitinophagaceae bacterium]
MKYFCSRKICAVVSIVLLVTGSTVFAQEKKYQLPELANAAKNHLPVLLQKQALVDAAKANVTDTRHSFLPQLKISDQVNIGTDNSLAGSYLPIGITPSSSAGVRADNIGQAATGNIGALYAEYELINFGLNNAKLNNAKAYTSLQQSDLEREQYLLQASVANAYFSLLKAKYKLDADEQNVRRYDSIFKVIQALTASGIKAGSDSSLSKAELSKARITYNQSVGLLAQLKDQLAFLTGIPAQNISTDSLGNDFIASKPALLAISQDTISNPLLDYYAKRNMIFESNKTLIKKTYMPKVLLAASTWVRGSAIQYNDDYKSLSAGLGYQRYNYMAGIALTYNLFNGLYKKDKLAINKFQLQASNYDLEQQKLNLALAATQADRALQVNEDNLAELPIQLKSAKDTYYQKLAQYKAGIISLVDLTNASFVLYRSQTDYIQTVSDWWLAQLSKATANGSLSQFIQLIK